MEKVEKPRGEGIIKAKSKKERELFETVERRREDEKKESGNLVP
jgi:hypothetical protein